MKTFYVYIVKCRDESYYTGITNDIERRLEEHNFGESPDSYTAIRRPVKLVFVETFNDFAIAEKGEKKNKRLVKKEKRSIN